MVTLRNAILSLFCGALFACATPAPREPVAVDAGSAEITMSSRPVAEQGQTEESVESSPPATTDATSGAVAPAAPSPTLPPTSPGQQGARESAATPASSTPSAPVITSEADKRVAPAAAEPATPPPKPAPIVSETPKPRTAAPATSTLRGSIKLVANRGVLLLPGEVAEAFVYYLPREGGTRAAPGRFEIETRDKRFVPATLIVPVGSTVKFPNRDVVLHNAFSVSPGNAFDLGIYGGGDSREFVFGKSGLVLVHCNVHHSMQADVLVVDTPYFARVNVDGSFELADLPAGSGSLYLWHPRAALQSRLVDVPAVKTYTTELVVTKPRVPPHLNKQGQTYRAARANSPRP